MKLRTLAIALMLALPFAVGAKTAADVQDIVKKLSLEQKARLLVGCGGTDEAPSHLTPGAAGWTFGFPSWAPPSFQSIVWKVWTNMPGIIRRPNKENFENM